MHTCPTCLAEYKPRAVNQKYCSESCYDKARRGPVVDIQPADVRLAALNVRILNMLRTDPFNPRLKEMQRHYYEFAMLVCDAA